MTPHPTLHHRHPPTASPPAPRPCTAGGNGSQPGTAGPRPDDHAESRAQAGGRYLWRALRRNEHRSSNDRSSDDRGSVTIEVALLAPALLALLGLALAAGRYEQAASAVEGACAAAARAASLARTPSQARRDATSIATTALNGQSPPCRDLTVAVDTSGFQTPATQVIQTGTPAQIAVTITCQIGLGVPGLSATKTIISRTVSVLDTFRATT